MPVRFRVWLMLIGILLIPRSAHAGFWDIIWEMTGPGMSGYRLLLFEMSLSREPDPTLTVLLWPTGPQKDDWFWITAESHIYHVTKDVKDGGQSFGFGPGSVKMVSLDPMLAFGRRAENGTRVYSAIGASLNRFFGSAVESPFVNEALKLRPLAADRRIGSWIVGAEYNVRLYGAGFESNRNPISFKEGGRSEIVHGLSIEIRYDPF